MEEETLYDRIGETDFNPTYVDGQTFQHTDVNKIVSITKEGVNENYYDIQRMQNGTKSVGNAMQIDGATLSRYIDETLQANDNKVPTSQQTKEYIDGLFADYSAPVRGVDYWTEDDKQEIIDETSEGVEAEIDGILEDYAKLTDIPSDISSFNNDREYVTADDLQTALGAKANQSDLNTTNQNISNVNTKVEKKPYYYNTLSDLKNDLSLKDGDCAITLGYYEANDGGAGTYEVVNDNTLIEDGGTVFEVTNGLYAKLISNEINVKQFGAKGNGTTDDTNAFVKAISYSKNLKTKALAIALPCGKYKITETINLPLYVKLYTLGNVEILYTGQNELFHIYNDSDVVDMVTEYGLSQNPFNIGNVLDGSKGVLILKGDISISNQIALKIGETTQGTIHRTHTAWANFTNVYIEKFNKGIFFTNYQNFIMRFYNITISNCGIAVSNSPTFGYNSGELIEFLNCSLNNNDLAVQVNHVINFNFNNSSIDYNDNGIELNWQGYYTLKLLNCWLEANNDDTLNTFLIKSNVPTGSGSYSLPCINISDCLIYPRSKIPHKIIFGKMRLNIENCQIQVNTYETHTDLNSEFLCDNDVFIMKDTGNTFVENAMLISESNVINKNWDFSDGENGYSFNQYGVTHEIVTDLFYTGSKLLKLNNDSAAYQTLTSSKFSVLRFKKLLGQIMIAIMSENNTQKINCSITLKFFDSSDTELSADRIQLNADYTYSILNELTLVPLGITKGHNQYIDIPNEAYTCQLVISFGNLTVPIYVDNIALCGF